MPEQSDWQSGSEELLDAERELPVSISPLYFFIAGFILTLFVFLAAAILEPGGTSGLWVLGATILACLSFILSIADYYLTRRKRRHGYWTTSAVVASIVFLLIFVFTGLLWLQI